MNNLDQDSSRLHSLEVQVKTLSDKLDKLESEKYSNHDIMYLKEVVEFQNAKVEKLTTLINDFLKGDNNNLLLSSIQDNDVNVNDQVNQVQDQVEQQVRQHVAQVPSAGTNNHGHHTGHHSHPHINNYKPTDDLPTLDSNIHPELHVAQTPVNNSQGGGTNNTGTPHDMGDYGSKPKALKRKQPLLGNGSPPELKRPKIIIDFIHNPMTVKEIYDEFTKGFRGQPPLADLDEKYGKNQWRGDSRSKESKRFQRRKRLCDAIRKGMMKYDKTAEEIISYIEEFRGDKSLTWVMNGNLPEDLLL